MTGQSLKNQKKEWLITIKAFTLTKVLVVV
jgi:hypothetical protein